MHLIKPRSALAAPLGKQERFANIIRARRFLVDGAGCDS